jgi:hypothetical protein
MAKGKKTGGGSRKGRPNTHKSTFRTQLRDYCASLGVDPHRFMADMIADTSTVVVGLDAEGTPITAPACKPELKLAAARELAQYLEPKLKAVDMAVRGLLDVPRAPAPPLGPTQGKEWCSLHNVALHLNHGKDGRTWWSHRLSEGGFCKGK